jgi:S-(hydroxymethyl)glutathione dehydrogenase/alcohol dehydrogenase
MGTEFRAAVLTEIGKPLEIYDLRIQSPLLVGQVLVRIHSSGVCGSQLLEIAGGKGNSKYVPHLLGHEGFGEVLEVGQGVSKVCPGDFVVLHWRRSSGTDAESPIYLGPKGGLVGSGKLATFTSLSVVSENRITRIGVGVDAQLASLMGCGLSTGMAAVAKQAKVSAGQSVLVLGSGGIGLSVCLAAHIQGAKPIVVVDKDASKSVLAKSSGATDFLCMADVGSSLDELFSQDYSFDVVFETTGSKDLTSRSLSLTRDGGTVIQLGQSSQTEPLALGLQSQAFGSTEGKKLIFSQGGGFEPESDLGIFTDLILRQAPDLWRNLIGPVKPLEEVNLLIQGLREGVPGRPMISF